MGKLLISLEKQLKTEHKQDAEDCLKIYNYLKETTDRVWDSQWYSLVSTDFKGSYPNSIRVYKPNNIGKIFLKGLRMKKKQLNLFGTKNQLSLFPEKPLETIPNPKYDKLGKQLEKELLDKLTRKR